MDRRAGDGPHRGHAWAAAAVGGCMHDGSQQEEAGGLSRQYNGAFVPRPLSETLHGAILRVV